MSASTAPGVGAPGQLYIVSAPSGAGKTSLVRAVVEAFPDVVCSVSHTTRPMRAGEVPGVSYHYVSELEFNRLAAAGAFLEHARVFDQHYGTSRTAVEHELAAARDVILEIDWQGARQVRALMPGVLSIFILPPSLPELEARLRRREGDRSEVVLRRMRDARAEIDHHGEYDYLVVNDDFDRARDDLLAIVRSGRLRRGVLLARQGGILAGLLAGG